MALCVCACSDPIQGCVAGKEIMCNTTCVTSNASPLPMVGLKDAVQCGADDDRKSAVVVSFPNLARVEELCGKETDPGTTSFFLPFPFSFHIKDICHYTPSSSLSSLLGEFLSVVDMRNSVFLLFPGRQIRNDQPATGSVGNEGRGKLYFI